MDRQAFFAGVRHGPFPGKLLLSQVNGMTAILDEWDRRGLKDMRWLAYKLATTFHETAATMQPVMETRQPSEPRNPSVDVAIRRLDSAFARGRLTWVKKPYWKKDADGLSWLGRGLPQVTHKRNYAVAEQKTGIPFTKDPDLMLVMEHAVPVMFSGMIEGWFTGKKLGDYFHAGPPDWRNARKIINSLESADKVAGIAKQFYADLVSAT